MYRRHNNVIVAYCDSDAAYKCHYLLIYLLTYLLTTQFDVLE